MKDTQSRFVICDPRVKPYSDRALPFLIELHSLYWHAPLGGRWWKPFSGEQGSTFAYLFDPDESGLTVHLVLGYRSLGALPQG